MVIIAKVIKSIISCLLVDLQMFVVRVGNPEDAQERLIEIEAIGLNQYLSTNVLSYSPDSVAKFDATARLHGDEIRAQVSGTNFTLIETDVNNIGLNNKGTTNLLLPL